ncbi:MAG TPA: M67 family metallopeptidase [Aggregatilineales bacterium]|nr:M67 family metallopeptidase [Anaerolineales bacterium]HRE46176.1 M67 family metallopeptidase [Aggregatilineales bacterium]
MSLTLSAALRAEIVAQLEGNYPDEGGGFLLGTLEANAVTVREVRPVVNTAPSEEAYHRYFMTPMDWAMLEDEADAAGLSVVGYYHSHPDSPAIPSDYDRTHALPNFRYLITSVRGRQAAEMRAWLLNEDRGAFVEVPVQIS